MTSDADATDAAKGDTRANRGAADAEHGALWIFGYGSLMWRPGFAYAEVRAAELVGYRRDFCVYSTHHRGTAKRPGLVLGLDRGGVCHGLAFRIFPEDRREVLAYLRAREQINGVYRETSVPLRLARTDAMRSAASGPVTDVDAVAYVVERAHPSYCGGLPLGEKAKLIRGATGLSGPNIDYLANTLARAEALGLDARDLRHLMITAGPFFARRPAVPRAGVPDQRPAARALVRACAIRRNGPMQPRLGERRRFVFRINREKAARPA